MSIFNFKQFSIDQTGAAMKVNTDAVLLAVLSAVAAGQVRISAAKISSPSRILDIGTGTGVIAMMLSQKYPDADIDAVEIEGATAALAARNFENSSFPRKPRVYGQSFQSFFESSRIEYDLIVSNPPFFLNSLKSSSPVKRAARHADETFFEELLKCSAARLSDSGTLNLILPLETADFILSYLEKQPLLSLAVRIQIKSFKKCEPFRTILVFTKQPEVLQTRTFIIYETQGVYSQEYKELLKDYLTIF